MDDTDSNRDRAPDWQGRPKPMKATRRREREIAMPSPQRHWLFGVAIVLGICLGIMALGVAMLRESKQGAAAALAGDVAAPRAAPQASASVQIETGDALERAARDKVQMQATQRREAATRQHEASEAATRAAAALQARREREWQALYKKPAYCDELQPTVDSVGCANDYIRARRAFDARFNTANTASDGARR